MGLRLFLLLLRHSPSCGCGRNVIGPQREAEKCSERHVLTEERTSRSPVIRDFVL